VVWGKKVEVVEKAFDSEWQDVHGDKTQNICEKVCVCGLVVVWRRKSCLKFVAIWRFVAKRICCNLEVYDLEETKGQLPSSWSFFWWLFVCEACGQEIKKMQNKGQNMCACQVPKCFFLFCLCVHS
jgi:hypothetical protein